MHGSHSYSFDLLLTVTGVNTNSSTCQLANSTRFCYGGEEKTIVSADTEIVSKSFPRQGGAPDAIYSTSYYFLKNQSGVILSVSTGGTFVVGSDYVSDFDQSIYVVGNVDSGARTVFEFRPSYATIIRSCLFPFSGGAGYGLALSGTEVFALVVSEGDTTGSIVRYNRNARSLNPRFLLWFTFSLSVIWSR